MVELDARVFQLHSADISRSYYAHQEEKQSEHSGMLSWTQLPDERCIGWHHKRVCNGHQKSEGLIETALKYQTSSQHSEQQSGPYDDLPRSDFRDLGTSLASLVNKDASRQLVHDPSILVDGRQSSGVTCANKNGPTLPSLDAASETYHTVAALIIELFRISF
jgi:hypothetical protein